MAISSEEQHLVPHIGKSDTTFEMQIPECCREGWPDCPHVVNRNPIKSKKNIGL